MGLVPFQKSRERGISLFTMSGCSKKAACANQEGPSPDTESACTLMVAFQPLEL